jgi:hypothetical protein
MYSDTECTRRTAGSVRSSHSTSLSTRYVHGLGSTQDLSKRIPLLISPSISEIIYNNETFPLLAEFLQIHGRESLVGFCAIVIGVSNLTSDKRHYMLYVLLIDNILLMIQYQIVGYNQQQEKLFDNKYHNAYLIHIKSFNQQ